MADYADRSSDVADVFLAESLAWRKPEAPAVADGTCLNCGAETDVTARWCDADCRDDWQRANPAAVIPPEYRRAGLARTTSPEPDPDEPERTDDLSSLFNDPAMIDSEDGPDAE
jgi:hypothetical protein